MLLEANPDTLLQVFGRFHIVLLHLPIGLIPGMIVLEFGAAVLRRPPPKGAVAKALPYGSCVAQVVDGRQVIAHMAQDLGRHEGLQVGAAAVRGGGAG